MAENNIAVNVSDVVKDYKIESLNLQSPNIGQDIVARFESINRNFEKLVSSDYLKGAKGDSVVTKKITLSQTYSPEDAEGYEYYKKLVSVIVSCLPDDVREKFFENEEVVNKRFDKLHGAEFTLVYEVIDDQQNKTLLTCLPFVYKDPLFGEITEDINGVEENSGARIDLSCVICYDEVSRDEDGNITRDFFRSSLIPTVHFDEQDKRFNWTINGVRTGLAAGGPVGPKGEAGTGVLIAEYTIDDAETDGEEGEGYNYKYQIYKIVRFHFHVDNDTLKDQDSAPKHELWYEADVEKMPQELLDKLVNNCVVFAKNQNASIGESIEEDWVTSTQEWIWGLLFIDNSGGTGKTVYKIREGGQLSDILGIGTHTLLNLMKTNRYNFIPYRDYYNEPRKDGITSNDSITVSGVDSQEGDVLYASEEPFGRQDDGAGKQRTLNIGPSSRTANTHILNSEYDKNYFNSVYIGSGTSDENYIQLGLNDKDFSAKFPGKPIFGEITQAQRLTTPTMGSATNPIYWSDGKPVPCGDELHVNIKGRADEAIKLIAEVKKENGQTEFVGVNAGSKAAPVYFNNGVPVECDHIDTQADKAKNAGRLAKYVQDIDKDGNPIFDAKGNPIMIVSEEDEHALAVGNETMPVYFNKGVPVACGDNLNINISKNAASADKLTSPKTGDSNKPVYFNNGVPVACGDNLNVNISGNAATASKLITTPTTRAASNLVGSELSPVYFKDGLPVACNSVLGVNISGNAATASKFEKNLNKGSEVTPIYFKDGVPVECKLSATAEVAKKLTVSNVGGGTQPIYFKDGIPVKCGDTLNVNISKNAATANKLATARKIDLTGAVAATEQNFDGSTNINIPVTHLYENYLSWGGSKQQTVGPLDMVMCNYLNANRLSFLPAEYINIEYSNDNGSSWKDYGASDDNKTSLVTTGLGMNVYMGKKTGTQTANKDLARITITAKSGNLYFSLKKIVMQISTNGAGGCYVKLERMMNGSTKYETVGTYNIAGWSGWNAITYDCPMGGTSSSCISKIRLTYGFTKYSSDSYSPSKNNVSFCVCKIAAHGENLWQGANSRMASTGNIYTWDVDQSVTFPANLAADTINASKVICPNIDGETITAKKIEAESSGSILGKSALPWNTIYAKNLKSIENAEIEHAKTTEAEIDKATIKNLILPNGLKLDGVVIQDKFPTTPSSQTTNIQYSVTQSPTWFTINSDVISKKSTTVSTLSKITLTTSSMPMAENNTMDLSVPKMIIPIAITYMNDYDDVKEWKGLKRVTNRYWADIKITNIKATITYPSNGSNKTITKTLSDISVPTHQEYNANKRHLFIAYPTISAFKIDDVVLQASGSKYKDITISVKLEYSVTRTNTPDGDAVNSRVGYVYVPGVKIHNTTPSNYTGKNEYSNTNQPSSALPSKISSMTTHNGSFGGTYIPKSADSVVIYLTKQGLRISKGSSYVEIVPPSNNGAWDKDAGGYVHACMTVGNTKQHLKKTLGAILNGGSSWTE